MHLTARHGLVHWQSWNLAHVATGPTDVGFVWDAQYGGLKWSGHPTTVLQVQSARPPAYLRATVLDDFIGDAWSVGLPRAADSLEPAAARNPRNQTPEVVTVNGLADTHLVGGSIPIRYDAGDAPLVVTQPGFAALHQNLPRGFRYTVWSYTARPTAAALRRSPPAYPQRLLDDDLLDVGRGVSMPAFGTPDRAGGVEALLTVNPELNPYVPLARLADEQAALLRLATLVADGVPPHEIFSAVSDEVAQLFASSGLVLRFEEDGLGIVSVGVSTGNDIPVAVSIGVAQWAHEMGAYPDRLIAAADHALYDAKKAGRNGFATYDPAPPLAPEPASPPMSDMGLRKHA